MDRRPLLVAHRGGRYPDLSGEQTVAHFARAVARGVDAIEVDLRRTRDGTVVCVHDPVFVGCRVAETSYPALLEAARAADAPSPARLEDLLDVAGGRCRLDLELKVPGIEADVLATTGRRASLDDVVFKSFEDGIVRGLKRREPGCTAGLVVGRKWPRYLGLSRFGELFPGPRVLLCGADFVAPNHHLVRLRFVERMAAAGVDVWAWTVNDRRAARRMVACGVAAVITDEVDRMPGWMA